MLVVLGAALGLYCEQSVRGRSVGRRHVCLNAGDSGGGRVLCSKDRHTYTERERQRERERGRESEVATATAITTLNGNSSAAHRIPSIHFHPFIFFSFYRV